MAEQRNGVGQRRSPGVPLTRTRACAPLHGRTPSVRLQLGRSSRSRSRLEMSSGPGPRRRCSRHAADDTRRRTTARRSAPTSVSARPKRELLGTRDARESQRQDSRRRLPARTSGNARHFERAWGCRHRVAEIRRLMPKIPHFELSDARNLPRPTTRCKGESMPALLGHGATNTSHPRNRSDHNARDRWNVVRRVRTDGHDGTRRA